METVQTPVSQGTQRILVAVQSELFPAIKELRELLLETQKIKIPYFLFSNELTKRKLGYTEVTTRFFTVVKKLETPEILFEGLTNDMEYMSDYFQLQGAFLSNIETGLRYVEIIDRTLDRKSQDIQNNRTITLAFIAILISIIIN